MIRRSERAGFSPVELLLLLGVLLLLFAALVPFLFRTRQAAGRTQGINNLKQLALALHSYNDNHMRMPPTVGTAPDGRHGTVLYHLLPYVEQQPIHNQGPVWQAGTIGVPLALYLDPRDKTAPPGNKYDGWLATTNYAANWLAIRKEAGIGNGFPDGTSNTLLFLERYQMCNRDPCAWAYDHIYYWAPMTGYYSEAKFQPAPRPEECDPRLPQSLEPEGILVALGDATARQIRYSISSITWYRALHPDDGLPIPAELFD